jgi:uncharacterized membrane protein
MTTQPSDGADEQVESPDSPPAADAANPARTESAEAAPEAESPAAASKVQRAERFIVNQLRRFSYAGLVVAVVMLWLSLTPSLLPRGPLFQGVVSGGSAAIGYCVGVFFAWLARYMVSRDIPWKQPRPAWWLGLAAVAVVGWVVMLYFHAQWEEELRRLMDMELQTWTVYPITIAITVVVLCLLMTIGRAWAALIRWLVRKLTAVVPPRIAAVSGAAIVVVVTIFLVNGVIVSWAMNTLNSSFAAANDETKATSVEPTSPLRSGGPGSLVSWDSLGREGRQMVGAGPSVQQLTDFNHAPAMEPIRVYVGLDSTDSIRERADIVVRELERTGAFSRKVIGLGTSTGSGWLNQSSMDSLEYMYNGDTAMASMQYSYLPSWLSFIADQDRARAAGRALFEEVDAHIRQMPVEQRPKVVVFGESLGSFGGESAFGTIPDIAARTDGALFSGPTFSNELWEQTTHDRDKGSPAWLPIYERGQQVRFVAEPKDLARPDAPWPGPRIVYLQHPSDPITNWTPRLLFNEPAWLKGSRGRDVLQSMTWIPIVTFLQVSADMAVSTSVPDGHGHTYLEGIPYSWAAILEPPGWTVEKTQQLIPHLTRD